MQTSCIYSTPWSCKRLARWIWGAGVACGAPKPREVCSTTHKPSHDAQGSKTLLHVLLVFVFSFQKLGWEQQSRCTLPAPPSQTPYALFLRAGEGRKHGNKIEKKKCRITFGHVSPRTLCAQVAIEKLPLRKRAAAVTINPTSSIPSLPNLVRMVRRAFCLLIFLSCLCLPSSPFLTLATSVLLPRSASLSLFFPASLSLLSSHSLASWLCPFP